MTVRFRVVWGVSDSDRAAVPELAHETARMVTAMHTVSLSMNPIWHRKCLFRQRAKGTWMVWYATDCVFGSYCFIGGVCVRELGELRESRAQIIARAQRHHCHRDRRITRRGRVPGGDAAPPGFPAPPFGVGDGDAPPGRGIGLPGRSAIRRRGIAARDPARAGARDSLPLALRRRSALGWLASGGGNPGFDAEAEIVGEWGVGELGPQIGRASCRERV